MLEEDFFTVPSVAVLDEHIDPASHKDLRVVDRGLLEEIAANSQRRIEDTGDECPIILGHTPEKAGEPSPPIVGFASNFRVEQFGRVNPRAAIVADFRFPKRLKEQLRQFPRRSVEVWPKDKIIDPIALLGSETPRRDLGLMRYSRGAGERVRYSMDAPNKGEEDMSLDMAAVTQQVLAALMETPLFKKLEALIPQEEQEPEHAGLADALAGDDDAAAAAPPAAKPALPPAGPEKMRRGTTHEVVRYQREIADLAARVDAVEGENARLRQTAEKYARDKVTAERRQALTELKSAGYDLDVDAAVQRFSRMGDDAFNGYIEDVRKYHRRSPVGVKLPYNRIDESGAPQAESLTAEQVERAVKYSRTHNVSYDEAIEKTRGK